MGIPFGLTLLLMASSLRLVNSFLDLNTIPRPRRSIRTIRLHGSFEYEYVPPDVGASTFETDLRSTYPPGTPAGLRGEAIRSALRSDRCLGWNLAGTPLEHGVVQVTGKGTLNFLTSKFTQQFEDVGFKEACLLTAKGKVIDRIGIAVNDPEMGFLLTSPGHKSKSLFDRLDPFIFPLDEVALHDCGASCLFSLASLKRDHLQSCFDRFIMPKILLNDSGKRYELPAAGQCLSISLSGDDSGSTLLVIPSSGLPLCMGVGYTFCFLNDTDNIGERVWQYLVSDRCPEGPIEAGALEFETLRIQSAQPAFGMEMTGRDEKEADVTPASPLELHLQAAIDQDKGCYLGQEGVASVVKNPRGPPRTLYQVVFEDEFNVYDYQSEGEYSSIKDENLTRIPVPGDRLFVLGSNEEIAVGRITSVAEPAGTGEPATLALALVRRADSIQKQMQQMGIEIPICVHSDSTVVDADVREGGSVLVQPPPLDPLDGLEIIVGGTFTIGTLKMVPNRRGRNVFGDDVPDFVRNLPSEDMMNDIIELKKLDRPTRTIIDAAIVLDDDAEEAKQQKELAKAVEEAKAASAEAKRKADKMELLRIRAEEAMERRKQKKIGS